MWKPIVMMLGRPLRDVLTRSLALTSRGRSEAITGKASSKVLSQPEAYSQLSEVQLSE